MPRTPLRREIKKAIDRIPEERLASLADYVAFLNRPSLKEQVEEAEREFKAGKGVNWRLARFIALTTTNRGFTSRQLLTGAMPTIKLRPAITLGRTRGARSLRGSGANFLGKGRGRTVDMARAVP